MSQAKTSGTSAAPAPRVLVVDDDVEFGKLMRHILMKLGFVVDVTASAEDFLAQLKNRKYTLAFLDLNMQRSKMGLLVVQAVRSRLGSDLPLIILSLSAERAVLEQAFRAGASDYLLKPLDRRVLAAKLKRWAETPELEEWLTQYPEAPEELANIQLPLDFEITEVDETGLRVNCVHLLSKGMRVEVGGPVINQITGAEKAVPLWVRDTWLNPDRLSYGHFLEFDALDVDLMSALRVWLKKRNVERLV